MEKPAILYVEDESLLRTALRRTLRRDEVEVLEAETCDQALELALEHKSRIKAVVLDYSLVREKTLAVISLLRESFGPAFPLISFTSEENGRDQQLANGCSEAVNEKDMAKLAGRIRELLAKTD